MKDTDYIIKKSCPACGHRATMTQNEGIEELWWCDFCHVWWFISCLGTYLPTETPTQKRIRERLYERKNQGSLPKVKDE